MIDRRAGLELLNYTFSYAAPMGFTRLHFTWILPLYAIDN